MHTCSTYWADIALHTLITFIPHDTLEGISSVPSSDAMISALP